MCKDGCPLRIDPVKVVMACQDFTGPLSKYSAHGKKKLSNTAALSITTVALSSFTVTNRVWEGTSVELLVCRSLGSE